MSREGPLWPVLDTADAERLGGKAMRLGQVLLLSLLLSCAIVESADSQTGSAEATPAISELVREVSRSAVGVISGPPIPAAEGASFGSGFVVDAENGMVLTAAHLIGDPHTISVLDNAGSVRHATIIALDESLDLALVRVDGRFESALSFASAAPQAGQEAFAVGRIVDGRTLCVGQGIVSAVVHSPMDALMLSFPLQRGMSGAPVVNARGEVIGIASAVASRASGALAPFGFAMPSATVQTWLSSTKRQ